MPHPRWIWCFVYINQCPSFGCYSGRHIIQVRSKSLTGFIGNHSAIYLIFLHTWCLCVAFQNFSFAGIAFNLILIRVGQSRTRPIHIQSGSQISSEINLSALIFHTSRVTMEGEASILADEEESTGTGAKKNIDWSLQSTTWMLVPTFPDQSTPVLIAHIINDYNSNENRMIIM